jgi:two-component system, chemotaxis family, CheB/CheR fusion protein
MRKPAPIRPAKKAQQKDNSRPAPRRATPPLVVGVGASAGGIEAFLELISHLPPQPGFSLVLVQHLAPDRESTLPEIFSRGCKMPVSAIREHTRVELNHIYVLPPNRGVRLQDGVLELERRQRAGR